MHILLSTYLKFELFSFQILSMLKSTFKESKLYHKEPTKQQGIHNGFLFLRAKRYTKRNTFWNTLKDYKEKLVLQNIQNVKLIKTSDIMRFTMVLLVFFAIK